MANKKSVEIKPVVCIGAALIDESFTCIESPLAGTSNPSTYHRSAGGVACNIAGNLSLLGHSVELISHFGNDPDGKWLMDECKLSGTSLSHSVVNDSPTGKYVAILSPDGELFAGAAASNLESCITPEFLTNCKSFLRTASVIVIDCNLNTESINWIITFCREENINCIIEPVSIRKAKKLRQSNLTNVLLITPNVDEIASLTGDNEEKDQSKLIDKLLSSGIKNLWIRNGNAGSKLYTNDSTLELTAPDVNVSDITGAGDAALAGWIHGWLMNKSNEDCLRYGHSLAGMALQVKGAIHKNLTKERLEQTFQNYK